MSPKKFLSFMLNATERSSIRPEIVVKIENFWSKHISKINNGKTDNGKFTESTEKLDTEVVSNSPPMKKKKTGSDQKPAEQLPVEAISEKPSVQINGSANEPISKTRSQLKKLRRQMEKSKCIIEPSKEPDVKDISVLQIEIPKITNPQINPEKTDELKKLGFTKIKGKKNDEYFEMVTKKYPKGKNVIEKSAPEESAIQIEKNLQIPQKVTIETDETEIARQLAQKKADQMHQEWLKNEKLAIERQALDVEKLKEQKKLDLEMVRKNNEAKLQKEEEDRAILNAKILAHAQKPRAQQTITKKINKKRK